MLFTIALAILLMQIFAIVAGLYFKPKRESIQATLGTILVLIPLTITLVVISLFL